MLFGGHRLASMPHHDESDDLVEEAWRRLGSQDSSPSIHRGLVNVPPWFITIERVFYCSTIDVRKNSDEL
jgi:hypothetical protein